MKPFACSLRILLILFLASVTGIKGQSPGFYQLYTQDLSNPETNGDEGFEKGEMTQQERSFAIWAPRLYPANNFENASLAQYEYVRNFGVTPVSTTTEPNAVKWTQLGPVGNKTNTPTVGQIHRITFHPGYNGAVNQVVYATSGFGGLWKSTDGAATWSLMNTDVTLPFCGVADVCVNSPYIYIATGYPDGSIYGTLQPNTSVVNPLFTQGVYRTANDGKTWESVNEGLLQDFSRGGVIRRIISSPERNNQLVLVSSQGVYYCENSQASAPVWKKGLLNDKPVNDLQMRGLELKPGNPQTVYAAGNDIYRSVDGGKNWSSMTGKGTGIEFDSLFMQFEQFRPDRINLAVSNLAPDLLYAYVMGTQQKDQASRMFLYRFSGGKWHMVITHKTQSAFDLYSQSYLGIAVSPDDTATVYWGNTIIHSVDPGSAGKKGPNQFMGYMTNSGGYVDIHALVFEPGSFSGKKLFVANHGGVSVYDFNSSKWNYKNTGICNATIWSFDDNETDPNDIIVALQDHGIRTRQMSDSVYAWRLLNTGGDGYSAKIFDDINKKAYHSNSFKSLSEYDFKTTKSSNINRDFPQDIPDPGSSPAVFITNSFPCELHPFTNKPYLGFSEIYSRIITDAKTPGWQLESDIGKAILPKWQRQITELAISKSDPNIVYMVTMGVDNGSNPTEKWHLNPRLFKSTTGFSEGNWSIDKFHEIILTAPGTGIQSTEGNVALPPVTGIAVHPDNPDKVWICFTGFSKSHKVYRSDDGGSTWINEDPEGKLNNLPVNGIVYQDGSEDRLYIATDAGVYTKDANSTWSRFGDLPNVRVTEIKINYCNLSIKAATFGRGVFETGLLPGNKAYHSLVITTNVIWNTDRFVSGNILIQKGASLMVRGKLLMPANGRITVSKNAELHIEGGLITNACGKMWEGIYLETKTSTYSFKGDRPVENAPLQPIKMY